MAYKLEVGIPREDGRIGIMHTFYGETRAECLRARDAHADVCPNFGPALKAGDTTEDWEEIENSDWPSVTGDDDEEDDDED
jgi:hypothetical protein